MKKKLNVVAALIETKEKIFLCQRKEDDHFGGLWEFPGGARETGESLAQAIEREIKEELGLEVEAQGVVGEFYDENATLIINVALLRCQIKAGVPKALECKAFGFFLRSEAENLPLAPVDKKICRYLKENR